MFFTDLYPEDRFYSNISQFAEEDIDDFFSECIWPDLSKYIDWQDAREKIQESNGITFQEHENAGDFTKELVSWLGQTRRNSPQNLPWGINGEEDVVLQCGYTRVFLSNFKCKILDKLCVPVSTHEKASILERFQEMIHNVEMSILNKHLGDTSPELKRYCKFIAKNKLDFDGNGNPVEWDLRINEIPDRHAQRKLKKMISFLFVSLGDNKKGKKRTLHILYNKKAISQTDACDGGKNARKEKIFLHELGHARLNLKDWYIERIINSNLTEDTWLLSAFNDGTLWGVISPSEHEFMAWSYAFSFRAYIKGIRSWLTRLYSDIDDEWQTV